MGWSSQPYHRYHRSKSGNYLRQEAEALRNQCGPVVQYCTRVTDVSSELLEYGFVGDSSSGGLNVGRAPRCQEQRPPTMPVGHIDYDRMDFMLIRLRNRYFR